MRRATITFAVVLLMCMPLAGSAAAQDTTPGENLGGYIGQASAMAFSFQPVFPAFLPTGDAPFEATMALTTANVRSGGNAFGRASSVWPGSAASDVGPLLGQTQAGPQVGALFPKWPIQAQANQDDGVITAGAPPALVMQATGFPDRAGGDARIADLLAPGLARISHIASTSTSVVTDSDVTSIGEVALHGVSLFNGHITFDTLHSISKTTSNGTTSTSTGDVTLSGLRIGGANVRVTDAGFKVEGFPGADQAPGGGGQPFPNASPEETVAQTLKSLNARITLFRSVGSANAGAADRITQGLVLSIDNPVGGQPDISVPGLPVPHIPPGHFDLILGATSSTTLGSPPFVQGLGQLPPAGGSLGSGAQSASIGGGPVVSGTSLSNLGDQLGTTPGSGPLTATIGDTERAGYRFGGVPIGLAIALLLAALLLARYIKRFFDSIMLAGAGSAADKEIS
jgi:hypothetical protein